jgi:hypothetical protein
MTLSLVQLEAEIHKASGAYYVWAEDHKDLAGNPQSRELFYHGWVSAVEENS